MPNVVQAGTTNQNIQNPVITWPKPVQTGSLLVVFFDWSNTIGGVSDFADNLGNQWQLIDLQQTPGTLRTLYCFATTVINPGKCSLTVSTDLARNYGWSYYEVAFASLDLDGAPIHTVSSGSLASSATTGTLTVQANSIVFAHGKCGNITGTGPGAPWNSISTGNHSTAYQIAASPGSFNATFNFTASTNWATTILAFTSTGAEPQPPPPGPVPLISCLCTPNQLADPNALNNPLVYAISARTHWANMQPGPAPPGPTNDPNHPSYSWGFIDSVFAQAAQFGKYVWLRIVVQEFDCPKWAQSRIQQYIDAGGVNRSVWYDSNYQAYMIAMIQAVAKRYGQNPLFKVFACNFAAAGAGDWEMPHVPPSTNPTGAANWSVANSWVCPAYNATVVVTPAGGRPVFPGWVVWVQGFGWFLVKSVSGGTANPTSVTLQNLGYGGNASSGTVSASVVMQVSDIQQLTSPMYNYTTDKVVNALTNVIDATIAAMPPNVIYSHEVGRNNRLDPQPNSGTTWSYNCATRMAQYGYLHAPEGRWAIAKNGWSAARSSPNVAYVNQDSDLMYLLAQTVYGSVNTSGTIGSIPKGGLQLGQFTWNVIDPSGLYLPTTTGGQSAYQVNGGVPYGPLDCPAIFKKAMDIIRLYGIDIIEVYSVDIAGGLLDFYLGYIDQEPPIRPNPQPSSPLIVLPPYTGQTQNSSIGMRHPPPIPLPEDGPRCSVYLPATPPESGTDLVPPPVKLTDIFSAQQIWPL